MWLLHGLQNRLLDKCSVLSGIKKNLIYTPVPEELTAESDSSVNKHKFNG